ncbi:DNA-directed DNA polymerase II small subunit [Candidatus Woesearchaeota archaeon]|nr:DNA-directed DNA polymerase II small subunit [Candidatus Woesearchaeota archaeon]
MTYENNQEIVKYFLKQGYLISPDFFEKKHPDLNKEQLIGLIPKKIKSTEKPTVLNNDLISVLKEDSVIIDINWGEFEKSRVLFEKDKNQILYKTFLDILKLNTEKNKKEIVKLLLKDIGKPTTEADTIGIEEEKTADESNVIIIKSYNNPSKKRDPQDFVSYYNNRYESIKKILLNRIELQNTVSINRLFNKNNREEVSIIGIVSDKMVSKNDNILLVVEDLTGYISVLVNKNKKDIYDKATNITLDEVIGITGLINNRMIFANNLFFPDVIFGSKQKKYDKEVYIAFISDIHVGSKLFLKEQFLRFINWLNGEYGSIQQRRISKIVKYLFIVGDLVDGVGIYPGQENELEITDVIEQYKECTKLLNMIRKDIKIIACGGQHDALRLSEPQPPFDKIYAKDLYNLPNLIAVSNPALINVNSTKDFEGFNILMYHGASFHYYIANIDSLRFSDSYNNPHYVVHYLIQKRHLAPTHSSTVYVPDINEDPLVIDKVPDIMVCGDMHRSDISQYNNIITINCSCWQAKTDFQEKIGNNPDPAKVLLFNLKTREIKILNFND